MSKSIQTAGFNGAHTIHRFDDTKSSIKKREIFFFQILWPFSQYLSFKDLAGYNAARGDFDWESDNLAEMELNVIEANDDLYRLIATAASGESDEEDIMEATDDCDNVLVAKLNFVALQVHNQRLKKRLKRKRIVKEFGLLNKARDLGLPRRLVHFYLYV